MLRQQLNSLKNRHPAVFLCHLVRLLILVFFLTLQ